MRAWYMGLLAIFVACGGDETTGSGGGSPGSGGTGGQAASAGGAGGQGEGGAGVGGSGGAPQASAGLMLVGSGDFGGVTGTISVWRLDYATGQATELDSVSGGTLKSFMAVDEPRSLVHVGDESEGTITTYSLGSDGSLTERATASSVVGNPVHLALDPSRSHLFVAHYGPGRTEVFGLDASGYVAGSLDDVATGAQTHSTLVPADGHLFAASKGGDQIAQLSFDGNALAVNAPVPTENGSGPRHMAMHPSGSWVYLVNENNRTLDTFSYDAGAGTLSQVGGPISLDLPNAPTNGTGADIHVHPSGAYLYASLRRVGGAPGELVRCDLDGGGQPTAAARVETQGQTPRNFDVTEDGRYVVVANQGSDNVVIFATDAGGGLSETQTISVPAHPFFVTVVDES